jgi:beta-lactamase class A
MISSITLGKDLDSLKQSIIQKFNNDGAHFALCFEEFGNSKNSIFINEEKTFHAASTMKTAVMAAVFNEAEDKKFKLSDSMLIKNDFISIVDSSHYSMELSSDGGENMYDYIGQKRTIHDIVYDMITVSSNLGTNLLIDLIGSSKVMNFLRANSIPGVVVLRGVEDQKAYDAGLNNKVTAKGLYILFKKMGDLNLVSQNASKEMLSILMDQKFNDLIPKYLPGNVKVAHKTGSITGVKHDGGIVYLPDGRSYILIILSDNVTVPDRSAETIADVSRMIYEFMK